MLRHSAADALGSLGVVLAGAFVLAGGSDVVDPIVGLLISVLILASSWRLIKEPFDVLMEAAPAGLDVDGMGAAICEEEGVRSVHDLHVWTVTAGFGAIAAHVVVAHGADRDLIRRRLELTLHERFGIEHTTLQMEEEAEGGLLRVENAPARTPERKRGCRDFAVAEAGIRRLASLGSMPRNRLAAAALSFAAALSRCCSSPRRPRRPQDLQSQLEAKQSELDEVQERKGVLTTTISRYGDQIDRLTGEVGAIRNREAAVRARLDAKQAELDAGGRRARRRQGQAGAGPLPPAAGAGRPARAAGRDL